jgi:hypothetical protein
MLKDNLELLKYLALQKKAVVKKNGSAMYNTISLAVTQTIDLAA